MPSKARFKVSPWILRYGGALIVIAAATLLRWLLNPALGSNFPLITYFAALVLVAWYGGRGPVLLSLLLGGLLAEYFFIQPSGSFKIPDTSDAIGLALYSAIGAGLAVLGDAMHRHRQRADKNALALAESRERLATILASISDAVIATDVDGRVTLMNGVAQSLTGWNQEDASGKPIQNVFGLIDEATGEPVESPVATVLRDAEARMSTNHALLVSNDGRATPVEEKSVPVKDDAGTTIGVVLAFRDITRRRAAEQALHQKDERFRTMADTAPVMLWLSDAEGLCTFFNQPWLDFTGRTMEQEVGYGWADNVHPDDLRRCLDTYTSALKARKSFNMEYRLKRSDGEYRWVLDSGVPRYTKENEFIGFAGSSIDIADRKQVEAASHFLASIVQSSEDGIIGKTLDGAIVSWNAAAERIYGYAADEVEGKHISILSPPDRLDELSHIFQTLRRGGSIPHLETKRQTKDGRLIEVALTISPIYDEGGRITGASTIVRDITERKRVEQERSLLAAQIENGRQRLNNVVANVPGVVWEAWGQPDQASQRIDFVSEHVEKMLGYSVNEWLSTPNFWLSIVHPEDKERAAEEASAIFASGKGGTSRFRWTARDGRVVWVEAQSVVVCDDAENPIGMRGVTMDITERKRAEDAQRFLAEASGLLASSLDYETTLASVAKLAVPKLADWYSVHVEENGELRQLAVAHPDPVKVEAARELRRRYPLDLNAPIGVPNVFRTGRAEFYPQIDQQKLEQAARNPELARILREQDLKSCMIVPLVARNRTLGTITLVTAESGRHYDQTDLALAEDLAHRIALAVDNARLYREAQDAVTAREEALRLRNELLDREHFAREEAETANRAKDEFLATVSHELRTPLNAILGWAHMLRNNQLDQTTQARALETVERNAKSQAQLIEDILDVSRIVTGKVRLDVRPVELTLVIEAALDSVRPAADARDIQIEAILDPRAGPISGDPDRLQQIVWNLAANAVKFTPKGGRVQVRLERVNSHIQIVVSDNGHGISAEFLPYVFDRFRQADATSTRRYGGLGLGLAIVRHLAEMHGGTVRADSPGEGMGATFTVKLPVMVAHVDPRYEDGVHPTAGGSTTLEPTPRLEGVSVLVVDDEHDTREMLKVMIGQLGSEVKACASSEEAISLLSEWTPDVIVSDIEMPGEDGYEFIRRVRILEANRSSSHVPAVALTAYARVEDRLRALSAGYQMHIAKPAEPAELAAMIASLAGSFSKGTSL